MMSEVGEIEIMRCRAEMEQGCHITEMTNLYWICVGGHSYYLLDTLSEIHPSMIFKTRPNMQSASIQLVINETFSHELPDCQL